MRALEEEASNRKKKDQTDGRNRRTFFQMKSKEKSNIRAIGDSIDPGGLGEEARCGRR